MVSRLTFVTSAALALALAGCGDNNAEDTAATAENADLANAGANVDAKSTATPAAMGETPTTAPEFVAAAAAGGMYEVESSKLAQQMATNPDVKAFAEMMVKDHTEANAALKSAAAKAGPNVTVPATMDAVHQAMIDQLRNAGAGFDRVYIDQQSKAHDKTLALLNGYVSGGDSQPIKDWANATLPTIRQHDQKVEEIAGKM